MNENWANLLQRQINLREYSSSSPWKLISKVIQRASATHRKFEYSPQTSLHGAVVHLDAPINYYQTRIRESHEPTWRFTSRLLAHALHKYRCAVQSRTKVNPSTLQIRIVHITCNFFGFSVPHKAQICTFILEPVSTVA